MLNVIQYVLAEESYGEKSVMEARNKVRAQIDRLALGLGAGESRAHRGQDHYATAGPPVSDEAEVRQKHNLPDNVKLLPPLPPPMVPQDGPIPFPGLDPPVG